MKVFDEWNDDDDDDDDNVGDDNVGDDMMVKRDNSRFGLDEVSFQLLPSFQENDIVVVTVVVFAVVVVVVVAIGI